jgi:hypothetical protein
MSVWLCAVALVVAAIPNGCNACPKGTTFKQIWVASVPKDCELLVSREGAVVSYTATCADPEFRTLAVCVVTMPEQPTTEPKP